MTCANAYATVRRHTLLSAAKLRTLWDINISDVPGCVAELGVYRGGALWLLAQRHPDREVHGYDTFTGIPPQLHDPALDWHKPGEFSASVEEVSAFLSDCPNVELHPGLFPETAVDVQYALVHLDADLYESTRAGLEYFWPRLSKGGALVLDDFDWSFCRGVMKAVAEFLADKPDVERREAGNQLVMVKP